MNLREDTLSLSGLTTHPLIILPTSEDLRRLQPVNNRTQQSSHELLLEVSINHIINIDIIPALYNSETGDETITILNNNGLEETICIKKENPLR